jgi:pimeloyl-ACP methyl ester carboxylesterase
LETLAADTNAILMEAREAGMSTSFIRHSQGTAQILALLSMNPDVPVEKVVLLAPVTTMDLQRIKLSNGEFTELANAMFAVLETGRTDFLDLSLGDSLSREMTKCMLVWV